MAVPGTSYNPKNPYKSVVGPTWARGANTNAIAAINNPQAAAMARATAQRQYSMGRGGLPPSQQQLFGPVGSPSYGMDSGGQGSQFRIGNRNGVMAPPSPTSPQAFTGGLHSFYNNQREGMGPLDNLNDAATVDHAIANTPYVTPWRQQFPWAFPQQGAAGNPGGFAGAAMKTNPFHPDNSFLKGSQKGIVSGDYGSSGIIGQHDEMMDENAMYGGGRARGGDTDKSPLAYLVGEEGFEGWKPKSGGMHIIGTNGPEVVQFPEEGEVIPHKDMKKMIKPMRNGGYNQANYSSYSQPQYGFGEPTFQPPPNFSPQAAAYLPQYMPQQPSGIPAGGEAFANDPNAPSSPWALARFIRMGLQQAARRRIANQEGADRVAQVKEGQAQLNAMGYTPPSHGGQPWAFSNPVRGGGSVSYSPHPRGNFGVLDISGNPADGIWGGGAPMTASVDDPSQVTWPQANSHFQNSPYHQLLR